MAQNTYTVKAPNGQSLDITGDRVPTEAELRDIFKAAGVDAPNQGGMADTARRANERVKTSQQPSAMRRFVGGAAEMLNPITMVQGAYQMVRHPLDTYEGMVDQSAQQFVKARDAYARGGISEAIGHSAAGVIPIIGPLAAEIGEQAGEGDIAGAAGKTFGLLAGPKAVKEAVKLPARIPGVANALERGAAARVADVMRPKASNQMARRLGGKADEIAPAILRDSKGAWSRAALHEQIMGKLEAAEGALDAAADARLAARAIDTRPILDALQESRNALTSRAIVGSRATPVIEEMGAGSAPRANLQTPSLTRPSFEPPPKPQQVRTAAPIGEDVVPAPNMPRVGQIDQAMSELRQLGPVSQYEPLRVMRQAYDGPAKTVYNPSLVDDFLRKSGEAKGAADVTAALRKTLADADPATAQANAQYALYRSANDILEAAEQIERAKPKVGRQIMARLTGTLFGAQAGGVGGAAAGYVLAPSVEALLNAGFTTKLKTAQLMQGLATAIRRGSISEVNSLTHRLGLNAAKARVPSLAAGRQKELAGQE